MPFLWHCVRKVTDRYVVPQEKRTTSYERDINGGGFYAHAIHYRIRAVFIDTYNHFASIHYLALPPVNPLLDQTPPS